MVIPNLGRKSKKNWINVSLSVPIVIERYTVKFLRSSKVERNPVKIRDVGSSPTGGAYM